MSFTSIIATIQYIAGGATTVFSFPYLFLANSHLRVVETNLTTGVETVKEITTHYTVTGAGEDAGGDVTFLVAPTAGRRITITRVVPKTQETDYEENGDFASEDHEEALDKLTMIDQQMQRELDRCLKFPESEPTGTSAALGSAVDRANKILTFDNDGLLSLATELGQWRGTWATSTAYVARDFFKDPTTGSVYFVSTAHTSSTVAADLAASKIALVLDATLNGNNIKISVTQANSFVIGDVIYHNGTTYEKAQANAWATAQAIAIVSAATATTFEAIIDGSITLSGLTAGVVYFLSDSTAGALKATVKEIRVPIGIAVSTTELKVNIGVPFSHIDNFAADTGAADAYAVAPTPAFNAYFTGMRIRFKATNANTGASTVNVNALGVKDIKKSVSSALTAGDIAADQIVELTYDGTNFQMDVPIFAVASQAEMETASDTTKAVTPGRTQHHPGVAKAWVVFNGTGTPAIIGSYNATSITDNDVGNWTVNLTTAFSSTNYSFLCGGDTGGTVESTPTGKAVGSFNVFAYDGALAAADLTHVCVCAFGDQ